MKKRPVPLRYIRSIKHPIISLYQRLYPEHFSLMWQITEVAARINGYIKHSQLRITIPDAQLRVSNLMGKVIHFAQYQEVECYRMHADTLGADYQSVCNYIWDTAQDTHAWLVGAPYGLLSAISEATYGN